MIHLQGADTAAGIGCVCRGINGAHELKRAGRGNPIAVDLIAVETEEIVAVVPEILDVGVQRRACDPEKTSVGSGSVGVDVVRGTVVGTDEVGDVDPGNVTGRRIGLSESGEGGEHGDTGDTGGAQHEELL